jgi:hypothetical protein
MIDVRPGDFAVIKSSSLLGKVITLAESREALGNPEYIHSFIIAGADGTILDTLLKVCWGNLSDYSGVEALIGRWDGMNDAAFQKGLAAVIADLGDIYPISRLELDALDLGRFVYGSDNDCSERTIKFLHGASGDPRFAKWAGFMPSDVSDIILNWKGFSAPFAGVLP